MFLNRYSGHARHAQVRPSEPEGQKEESGDLNTRQENAGYGASFEGKSRAYALRLTQTDRLTLLRHHQIRDGILALLSARIAEGYR